MRTSPTARRIRVLAAVAAVATLTPVTAAYAAPSPAASCDPTGTPPVYGGDVPSPKEVLGFELGEREVTAAESDRYLRAVSRAGANVVDGVFGRTAQGRPLRYAIAGDPANISGPGLARIVRAAKQLRDPATPPEVARRIAASTPAILWIAGNVHGNEESGTDASLRVLRDVADRTDCAATGIRKNAITVIVPTQNPDGREADTRQNAYGFDMNRDWFARTQPEVDSKLELIRALPPAMFIDAHEMPNDPGFFFPPNADPVYHEVGEEQVSWINDIYGPRLAEEFDKRDIPYFTSRDYDLFYMGYGDTVPITAFGAAGMTFEKGGIEPIADRAEHAYLTQWTSLAAATANTERIQLGLHTTFREAYEQGRAGELEPNRTYVEGNEVRMPVPDRTVRHYFLRADGPGAAAARTVVRRLQRMDVTVRRLSRPLTVPDYRAYGREPARTTLPAGTYWISMAQGTKHWIQAMLHEDSYTPFPYFYDVTGWSLPLLAGASGGSSGAELRPSASALPTLPAENASVRGRAPRIAVLDTGTGSRAAFESLGWLRHRLDRDWRLSYTRVTPAQVAAGALDDSQVLLVPNVSAAATEQALGEAGADALTSWVRSGGRYIGWSGGTALAARLGLTTATLTDATSSVPGSLIRTNVDTSSPIASELGKETWQFYASEPVLRAGPSSKVVASYPASDSADWFVSGFQEGAEELGGTAAVVSEATGDGDAVLFGAEPNFRAYTDATARLLLGAIAASDVSGAAASDQAVADARTAAEGLSSAPGDLRVTVRAGDADATADALRGLGATWAEKRADGRVTYVIANPRGLTADEHPWARDLPGALTGAGVRPLAVMAG